LGTEYVELLDSEIGKGVFAGSSSGPTHMALIFGCTTMIIPYIIDQFAGNKIIATSGTGLRGSGSIQRDKFGRSIF